jgi:uncharacterized protein (DUF983 family)
MSIKVIREEPKPKVCSKCNGKGYVFEGKGKNVHTCWNCLEKMGEEQYA